MKQQHIKTYSHMILNITYRIQQRIHV